MSVRYQIIGEINQGGVGRVMKAWDTRLQRNVAIKGFLSAEQRAEAATVNNDLLREASALSAMQHPNIVSIYDVEMDGPDGPQVVMEYLNGQDLEQAVAEAALTLDDFCMVAQQTLDALSHAHRLNLLHRDIKPSNIQVTWLANGKFVSKFVDFGLAKFFAGPLRQTVRHDGTVMGSVHYMSPEQLERLPLDHRSDLYSLGCVFYFSLTMHRPFSGATVQDVIHAHLNGTCRPLRDYRPNIPQGLADWVAWLIRRRPDDRPPDAETALAALRTVIDSSRSESAALQPELPASPAAVEPPRRRPRWAPAIGAAAALATGVGLALHWQTGKAGAPGTAAATSETLGNASAGPLTTEVTIDKTLRPSGIDFASMPRRDGREARHRVADVLFTTPNSGTAIPTNPPAAASLAAVTPPERALVLWFDAAQRTFIDDSAETRAPGTRIGQWRDVAPLGGFATLQYTHSARRDRANFFPELVEMPADFGLRSPAKAISFAASGQNLLIRDADHAGDPLVDPAGDGRSLLDSEGLTILVVFRSLVHEAPDALMVARDQGKGILWSLGVSEGGLVTAPGSDAVASRPLVIPDTDGQFRIASLTLDYRKHAAHRVLIAADGRKATVDFPVAAPGDRRTELVRLGCAESAGMSGPNAFAGEIAEILVYNEALDRPLRLAAENYLRARHFGDNKPTVAVH